MHILIVSALFPPDIAHPAPYLKELAARMALNHQITVLTYGAIPETVAGATIITVSKQLPAPLRLAALTFQLIRYARANHVALIHNAPSTELPLLLASWFCRAKVFLVESDTKIRYQGWRKTIHTLAQKRVKKVIITPLPLPRPEEHPFHPPTDTDQQQYQNSWETYLKDVLTEVSS